MIAISQRIAGSFAIQYELGAHQPGDGTTALVRHRRVEPHQAVAPRDVELPAEPHQREAALQEKFVAELLRRARIERPRGPVIHQEHAFRAPVRHFEQHGAIAMRGITRFQHVDVGRKLHESLFIARRLIDIRNDPVSRVGRIDGEIGFADETFVRTRGPE